MSAILATKPFDDEKQAYGGRRTSVAEDIQDHMRGRQFSTAGDNVPIVEEDFGRLQRGLKGRHLQMIAIGPPPRPFVYICL